MAVAPNCHDSFERRNMTMHFFSDIKLSTGCNAERFFFFFFLMNNRDLFLHSEHSDAGWQAWCQWNRNRQHAHKAIFLPANQQGWEILPNWACRNLYLHISGPINSWEMPIWWYLVSVCRNNIGTFLNTKIWSMCLAWFYALVRWN